MSKLPSPFEEVDWTAPSTHKESMAHHSDLGFPHFSTITGACMCECAKCFGAGGCRCRGCSGHNHIGCRKAHEGISCRSYNARIAAHVVAAVGGGRSSRKQPGNAASVDSSKTQPESQKG